MNRVALTVLSIFGALALVGVGILISQPVSDALAERGEFVEGQVEETEPPLWEDEEAFPPNHYDRTDRDVNGYLDKMAMDYEFSEMDKETILILGDNACIDIQNGIDPATIETELVLYEDLTEHGASYLVDAATTYLCP